MIDKKIKARTDWIYRRRFLAKKIDKLLYPKWDLDYHIKHFYREPDHFVKVTCQHRMRIFKATQSLANEILGFQRPFWHYAKEFRIRHGGPPWPRPSSWYRPRSYKYMLRAEIHDDARSYVRNREKWDWIFYHYNEDCPHLFPRFNAEVLRQEKILAKERQAKTLQALRKESAAC